MTLAARGPDKKTPISELDVGQNLDGRINEAFKLNRHNPLSSTLFWLVTDSAILEAMGGGFTWGAALVRW
jgi:hypothetical protein